MTSPGDWTHKVSCQHFDGYWYARHDGKNLYTSAVYDNKAGEWIGISATTVAGDSVDGCYFEPDHQVSKINKFKGNK